MKAWQNWQAITSSLTKKREAKVKAELGQRMDKVSILRQEIAELERQQDMAQENFDRISRQIKKEVEQFDERKAFDFKKSIVKYLEDMQKSQEKIAAQWERYLPEVQQLSIWTKLMNKKEPVINCGESSMKTRPFFSWSVEIWFVIL